MNNDQALAKLYRKRRIVKFIIILVALSLLVGVLALTGHAYATSNNYCSLCHEMSPEYVTWQASSHSKLACTACHQVDFIDQIYQHLRNQYFLPIVTPAPVANAVCEKCHNLKIRTVSATGDIKIPHQQHLAQGVLCVDCHSGVAHGQIAVRQETVDGNWERWTAAMGKAQMGRQFTATGMKQCIDCHESRRVSTKCEACHTEIVMPPDHKTAKWLGQGEHGRQARINLAACDRCHSFSSTGQVIHGLDKLTNYTRTNTFCAECHQKAPANHGPTWRIEHGAKAVDSGKSKCLVCHSTKKAQKSDNATKTFCQECHKQQHQSFSVAQHPVPLPPGTKPTKTCTKCHSSKLCATCHYIPGVPITKRATVN